MPTTTNYGWTTPADTDLVKDGASAIRTLGTAIDTTVYNNANAAIAKTLIDAKGDLIVGSAADTAARLAVGTNGYVLKANSSATNGVEWAEASAGALTLISTTTFSGVSSHSVNSVFSSTYRNYRIDVNFVSTGGSNGINLNMRLRSSGSDLTNNYNWSRHQIGASGGTTNSVTSDTGQGEARIGIMWGNNSTPGLTSINVYSPNVNGGLIHIQANSTEGGGSSNNAYNNFYNTIPISYTADGFTLIPASGNITGTVRVYGYAN